MIEMLDTLRRWSPRVVGASLALALAGPPAVRADPPKAAPPDAGADARVVFAQCRPGDSLAVELPVPVVAGAMSTIIIPGMSSVTATPPRAQTGIWVAKLDDTLSIRPEKDVAPGTPMNITVRRVDQPTVSLLVQVVPAEDQPTRQWRLLDQATLDELQAADEARYQTRLAAETAAVETRLRGEFEREFEREFELYRRARAAAILNPSVVVPHSMQARGSEGKVRARITEAHWQGADLLFKVEVENHHDQPYRLQHVTIYDAEHRPHTPEITRVSRFRSADPSRIADIQPRQAIELVVTVLDAARHRLGPMQLHLADDGALGSAWFMVDEWYETAYLKVMTKEEVEEERREKERRRREAQRQQELRERQREAERTSLSVGASIGAIWLPDGIDGMDEFAATSLTGVGVRVERGVTPLWAVEGTVSAGTSGTADFGRVNFEGTDGDLTRTAQVARAHAGGVFRVGDRLVPQLRFGAGVLVADQDSEVSTAGGAMLGPKNGPDATLILTLGAGVDYKLSEKLRFGIGLTFVRASDSRIFVQTIESGVNLSYTWPPE